MKLALFHKNRPKSQKVDLFTSKLHVIAYSAVESSMAHSSRPHGRYVGISGRSGSLF